MYYAAVRTAEGIGLRVQGCDGIAPDGRPVGDARGGGKSHSSGEHPPPTPNAAVAGRFPNGWRRNHDKG